MQKLLIIGCGMATARLLQELVSHGHDYQIEVIGEEASPGYNRVLLSALLAGDKSEQDLTLLERSWYAEHGIALHTGEQVVHVDTTHRIVTTNRDRCACYDVLVFATGALPSWPALPGISTGNVMSFRNQQDLDRIREAAPSSRHALVLGAGLLGLEAASGLRHLGVEVTVLHRQKWILNRQLDDAAAGVLQAGLERRGMHFKLGSAPVAVNSTAGKVSSVTLTNGEVMPADLLLVATGIDPNMELAMQAGVPCAKGILVDQFLQTRIPNVFALGECCQFEGQLFGLVAPVYQQASTLAAHLCRPACAVAFRHQDSPVHLKISGIHMVSAGQLPFPADSESQVISDPTNGIYRRLVFAGGRLVGFLLVGNKSSSAWYQDLLETRADISICRPWMMFGDLQGRTPLPVSQEVIHASH